jgi:ABC-type multidrug transport system fused ATPase/permease subunit
VSRDVSAFPGGRPATHVSLLRHYLRPHPVLVATVLVLLIAGAAAEVVGPLLMARFIDAAVALDPLSTLVRLALSAVAVALAGQVLSVGRTAAVAWLAWSTTNRLREDLTASCLRMDEGAHLDRSPGELVERVDGDSTAIREFISDFALQIVASALLILGVVGTLTVIEWRLGLAVLAFVLVTGWVFVLLRRHAVVDWREAREASAQLWGRTEESLRSWEDIKANGGGRFVLTGFTQAMDRLTDSFRRARTRGNRIFVITGALVAVGQGVVLAIGAVLVLSGEVSLGTLFATYFYLQLLKYPIDVLSKQLQHLQRATASVERLHELTLAVSDRPSGTATLPDRAVAVTFDGVTFSYHDRRVLDGVSFHVPAGTTLSLVGPTGAGKTTIAKLLTRIRDRDGGEVRLDGVDLYDIAVPALRRHVGMVPQRVELLPGTLRDNVTMFDPSVADDRVEAALRSVGLGEWLERQPDGLDTPVEGSDQMSAGEAQLIAVTRLLVRDRRLIVLDEATSRLDRESEDLLRQAVDRLAGDRTIVVIAHRLTTALRADQVLVLEDGRVTGCAPPAELSLDDRSRLARMLRLEEQEQPG